MFRGVVLCLVMGIVVCRQTPPPLFCGALEEFASFPIFLYSLEAYEMMAREMFPQIEAPMPFHHVQVGIPVDPSHPLHRRNSSKKKLRLRKQVDLPIYITCQYIQSKAGAQLLPTYCCG